MRTLSSWLSLLVLLFACHISLSPALADAPALDWMHYYGGAAYDEGKTVITTSDGNLAVTGGTESGPYGLMDGQFSLFTPEGRLLHLRVYGGPRVDRGKCIIELPDGDFLISGYSHSYEANNYRRVWVLRVGPTGDLIWHRVYGTDSVFATGFVITPCPEGGFYIAGDYQAEPDSARDAYALRIDADGNQLWAERFGLDRDVRIFYATLTVDNQFVLAGFERVAEDDLPDIYLVSVDSDGNQLWEGIYGTEFGDDARAITALPDGGVVVAGETFPDGGETSDVALMTVDENGNQLSWYTYGWDRSEQARYVMLTSSGDYLITGHTFSFGQNMADLLALKVTPDGEQLWNWHTGGPRNEFIKSATEIEPGRFIFTGQTLSPEIESQMFLAALDEVPETHNPADEFTASAPYTNEQTRIAPALRISPVLPNPLNAMGRFSVQLTRPGPLRVVLYDRLGRQVRVLADGPAPSGMTQLPLLANDLPSGVYYLTATVPVSGQVTRPFVVVK